MRPEKPTVITQRLQAANHHYHQMTRLNHHKHLKIIGKTHVLKDIEPSDNEAFIIYAWRCLLISPSDKELQFRNHSDSVQHLDDY